MATEDNPFAKYAGQTAQAVRRPAPVERPEAWVRPGEEDRSQRRRRASEPEPSVRAPIPATPEPARVVGQPAVEPPRPVAPAPPDDNPFMKFAGKSPTPHAKAVVPGQERPPQIDVSGTDADVRARILALPEKHRKAARDQWADAVVAKEREGAGIGTTLDDYVRRGAEGVVGGWGDRLGARLSSLVGKDYDEALAYEQARTRAAHRATDQTTVGTIPKVNVPLVGEVGGKVSTGDLAALGGGLAAAMVLPIVRASRALPYLRDAPTALLSRMVDYGATGAAYGGAVGAGSGNTAQERIENAKHSATLGGLIGAAAPPIGRTIGNVASRVRDMMTPMPDELSPYLRGSVDRVARSFEADAPRDTTIYGQEGMLADLGPNLRDKAGAVVATPGEGKRIIVDAVTSRRRGAEGRITADLDATLGRAENLVALEDRVTRNANDAARPHYEQFYNTPIRPTPRLQQLLDFAEANGLTRAADEAIAREVAITGQAPSLNMRLDFIKRQLDRMAAWSQTPAAGLDRHAAGQYRQLAHEFRNEVDRVLSPTEPAQSSWARARHASGEGLAFREGLEEGRTAFSRGTGPDQMAADVAGMSEPYMAGYVAGGRGAIRDTMGNAAAAYGSNADIAALKNLNSRYAQQKMETLVGPAAAQRLGGRLRAEAEFNRTYEDALRNSKTEARRSSKADVPNPEAEAGGIDLSPGSLAGRLVAGIADLTTGGVITERNMRIVREMAEMMVAQGARRETIADGLRQYIARTGATGRMRGNIDRVITHLLRGVGHGATTLATDQRRGASPP